MKKNTLSRQKTYITIFCALAVLLIAAYFAIVLLIKAPLLTVYKYDEDGDELYASIVDNSGSGITKSLLEGLVASGKSNKYDAKKSTEDRADYSFRGDNVTISYRPFIFPEIPLDSLSKVTVENSTGTFTVYRDSGSGEFLFEGAELQLYNSQSISTLLLQARYMLSAQKLEKPSSDLSVYGLSDADSPIKITVTDAENNVNTVLMGSKTADGTCFYMKHADKPYIYLMDSTASVFQNGILGYLSPVLAPSLEENVYNYMEKFSITKDGSPFISCEIIPEEERGSTSSSNLHRVIYPSDYTPSLTNFYDTLACFGSFTGTQVLEYNVSKKSDADAIFENYGLTLPSNDISYTADGTAYRVITGNSYTNSEGKKCYYAYSPYMDTIVELPVENAPFLDYGLLDFISENIFQYNINNIKSVSIKTPETSATFDLEGTGKDLKVTQRGGKTIDTASFRQSYISLLSITIEGYSDVTDPSALKNDLTFSVETTYGETFTYSFYTLTTLRCFFTVDGKGEFYTNREYIDKIASNFDKLLRGETISADY